MHPTAGKTIFISLIIVVIAVCLLLSGIVIIKQVTTPLSSIVGRVVSIESTQIIIRNARGTEITIHTDQDSLKNVNIEKLKPNVFLRITGKLSEGRIFNATEIQILRTRK